MSNYTAEVRWVRGPHEVFTDNNYSRAHEWRFDGGVTVPASSSPDIVPPPLSVAANVDPEEAFVAALSSCHMLFFLSFAAKRRLIVAEYLDQPVGVLGKDQEGKMCMTRVTLRPRATFTGERQPGREQIEKIHHLAHERCFIANSVKTEVVIEIPG